MENGKFKNFETKGIGNILRTKKINWRKEK